MHHARRPTRATWILALVPLALVACSDDATSSGTTAATAVTTPGTATSATTAGSDAPATTDGSASPDDTVGPTDATGATDVTATSGTGTSAPGSVSSDFSVAASLRQIPTSALSTSETGASGSTSTSTGSDGSADDIVIVAGDLDEASQLAGVSRPRSGAGTQDVVGWVSAITGQRAGAGSPGVAIMPAEAFNLTSIAQVDQIDDELGWSMLDVTTYVELQAPPQYFTAMTGHFDQQLIDAAQGERSNGIWSLGGEDFSVDLKQTSPARRLGQAVRSGLDQDGRLAQARSSRPVADWIADSNALDRDDGLEAVAKALDGQQVYSAMLVRSAFTPDPQLRPEQAAVAATLQPFDTLGLGSDHDDRGPILVLAYHSADEQDAAANVDLLRTMFTTGSSLRTQQPWSQLVELDDVQRDGKVVVATLHLLDGRSPMIGVQAVLVRDTFATHV